MAKIYLFGSFSLNSVAGLENILLGLYQQGHEFIVSDGKGADSAFHMSLSRIGALDRTTVYAVNKAYCNNYGIKERIFNTILDEANKQLHIVDKESGQVVKVIENIEKLEELDGNQEYKDFRDKLMMDECAIAICAWKDESKREFNRIKSLSIKNKPCYTYKF